MIFGKKSKEAEVPMMENPVSREDVVSLANELAEMKDRASGLKERAKSLDRLQKGYCEYIFDRDIEDDEAEDLESNLSDVEDYLEDVIDSLTDAVKAIADYR